jgi:hypothetical protein
MSASPHLFRRRPALAAAVSALLVLVLSLALGWHWSRSPPLYLESSQGSELPAVPGYVTADTLIETIDWLLDKPGGYLSNDIFPVSVWLDNMPRFELGVLVQSRDLARMLRNDYGRARAQPAENAELAIAETALNAPYDSWILPSTESRLREARDALTAWRATLASLGERDAVFVADAENLREWLAITERRLAELTQRLAASVTRSAGDAAPAEGTPNLTLALPTAPLPATRWIEIDDVFFEARGSAWALLQFLAAAETDFEAALARSNALPVLRRIRRDLEGALTPLSSPLVLNGGGYGLFANHSLVLASYLSRAQAGVIELRELLAAR